SITRVTPNPTKLLSLDFTVTLSEDVIGLGTTDFNVVTTVAGPPIVSGVATVSPSEYTVTVSPTSGEGTVKLELNGSGTAIFSDVAGNFYTADFTTGEEYIVDNTPPGLFNTNPLSPATISQAVPILATPRIKFNEGIKKTTTDNLFIRIMNNNGTEFEAYKVDTTTSYTMEIFEDSTIIIKPKKPFVKGAGYYITIDANAVEDIAGNLYPGFQQTTYWTFSTFSDAKINSGGTSDAACIGETITINGQYFSAYPGTVAGVTKVEFCDVDGNNCDTFSTTINIINDTQMTVVVPENARSGQFKLIKDEHITPIGTNPYSEQFSGTETVTTGPSAAHFTLLPSEPTNICNDGTISTTRAKVTVTGGSGIYKITYNDGVTNPFITIDGYLNEDDIILDPPQAGPNTFILENVQDKNETLKSCIVPVSNLTEDIVLTEYTRSVVEAGGGPDINGDGFGDVEVCLGLNPTIIMTDNALMTVLPQIDGDVQTGVWTIQNGPSLGGGGFSNAVNPPKTTTTLQPTYYPTLSDASFSGDFLLKLTSDAPSAPNPCEPHSDIVQLHWVSGMSANTGGSKNLCVDDVLAQLSVSLGGGAEGVIWSRSGSAPGPAIPDILPTWGFTIDNGLSFTKTTTNPNAKYKPSDEEVVAGTTILEALPTTSGTPCGPAVPNTLVLEINENPVTTITSQDLKVCEGETSVVYAVNNPTKLSTYTWNVPNVGVAANDNKIVSGGNGNGILLDFGTVTGINSISVQEKRNSDGCLGVPVIFDVEVFANPTASFNPQINHSQSSNNEFRLLLKNGVDTIPEGKQGAVPYVNFYGSGVKKIYDPVLDASNERYYFASNGLPLGNHIVNFSYIEDFTFTGDLACETTGSAVFNVFDANSLIDGLNIEYCEYDSTTTTLVPVMEANESLVRMFLKAEGDPTEIAADTGYGLKETSPGFYVFDPVEAATKIDIANNKTSITLEIFYEFSNPFLGIQSRSQLTTIYLRPEVEFNIIGDETKGFSVTDIARGIFHSCDYTGLIGLVPAHNISPTAGTSYYFSSDYDSANGTSVVYVDVAGDWKFDPSKVVVNDLVIPETITVYYTYIEATVNGFVKCENTVSKTIKVYAKPPLPTVLTDFGNSQVCVTT
ncbi:MAG: Ig-like domain-containing protein, partial [Cyclobacteriaceae bacterium]|nr:Ig-like domain-containing protein [Cyclobacteriaceae bacterium]